MQMRAVASSALHVKLSSHTVYICDSVLLFPQEIKSESETICMYLYCLLSVGVQLVHKREGPTVEADGGRDVPARSQGGGSRPR